jgi:hypothetical protein
VAEGNGSFGIDAAAEGFEGIECFFAEVLTSVF